MVFDIVSDDCLRPETMDRWVKSGIRNGCFPSAVPLKSTIDFFASRGFDFVGGHVYSMRPGETHLLAFRKSG
jgi:hypothetical protein